MTSSVRFTVESRGAFESHRRLFIVLGFALLLAVPFIFSSNTTLASGSTPLIITFQGKVTTTAAGTNVADGSYAFQFKLYSALTGGTLLWTETYDGTTCAKLPVTSGVFTVQLGSCSSLSGIDFTTGSLYLTVNFAPTGTAYDGEMSPRIPMDASPYAVSANNLAGNGRIDLAYTPSTTTYGGAAINYSPTISAANNALLLTAGSNVTSAALNIIQNGTGGSILLGATALAGSTQTLIGTNPSTFAGNFMDLQLNGTSEFKITSTGAVSAASLTLGTALSVANGGTGTTSYGGTNGVVYYNGTTLTSTAASTGTQCLQSASAGAAPTWASCGGGSSTWSGLQAPTANLAVAMGSDTTTFTYGASTGSANLFNLTDTTNNTGTGMLLNVATASGSAMMPFAVNAGGGNENLWVASNGNVSVQSNTNSSTAFQIENNTGIPVFVVDTTSTDILTNPGFEVNTTGWAVDGATSITRVTTNKYNGFASLQVVAPATANTGADTTAFTTPLISATQYTLSFYVQASGSNFTTLRAGVSNTGLAAGETACTLNSTSAVTTGWKRFSCTFTTSTVSGTPYIFIEHSDATAHTFFVDSVQLQTGSVVTPFYIGAEQLRGVVNSPATFESTSNSTTAFQVQDSTGTQNLLVADTLDNALGIGTATPAAQLDVQSTKTSGNLLSVSAPSAVSLTGTLYGINTNLSNFNGANGFSVYGKAITLPSDTNINTSTKAGVQVTLPNYTQATAASGLVDGLQLNAPGAISTTTAAGTLLWNGLDITTPSATANFAGSTLTNDGLKVLVGGITQTAGTATTNGIELNMAASTITSGGTINGLLITPPTTMPTVGTLNALNIGTSTSSTANTYDDATISVGNIASTATHNTATLTLQNGGTGNFDLELVRGMIDYESMNTLYDDFTGKTLDTNKWTTTALSSGVCPTAPFATGLNGYLQIATGTTAGKGCAISTQATPATGYFERGDNPVYETRVETTNAGSGVRIFAGFTNVVVTASSDTTSGAHAWIEKTAAGTQFICDTSDGTTETNTAFGPTIAVNTWYRLRVELLGGTTPEVVCTVDTGLAGGVTRIAKTTNIPAATTAEDVYTAGETSDTTSESVNIDYIRAWQDDPDTDGTGNGLTPVVPTAPVVAPVDFTQSGLTTNVYQQSDIDSFFAAAASLAQSTQIQQLYAARLTAGLELITPKVTTSGLTVDTIGALNSIVTFANDVQFIGRPYFNADTAGFAKISPGDQSVTITFTNPYLNQPIVSATMTSESSSASQPDSDPTQQEQSAQALFNNNLQYAVINKNQEGFTIYLNKPTSQTIEFSWIALAVKVPTTFVSGTANSQAVSVAEPVNLDDSSDISDTSDSDSSQQAVADPSNTDATTVTTDDSTDDTSSIATSDSDNSSDATSSDSVTDSSVQGQ